MCHHSQLHTGSAKSTCMHSGAGIWKSDSNRLCVFVCVCFLQDRDDSREPSVGRCLVDRVPCGGSCCSVGSLPHLRIPTAVTRYTRCLLQHPCSRCFCSCHSSCSLPAGSQVFVAARVSEAHQLKDGSHTTASDPQFGKSVKDMPRYSKWTELVSLHRCPAEQISHQAYLKLKKRVWL